MNLQDAITKGLITVRGGEMTFSRLLHLNDDPAVLARLPQADRDLMKRLTDTWRRLTPAQRQQIEVKAATLLARSGDYTSIVFTNNTGEPASIVISKATVVGEQDETIRMIDTDAIASPNATDSQATIQRRIWAARNRAHQQMLRAAGYYQGRTSDGIDEAAKASIARFQRDHSLHATGKIDSETEAALNSAIQVRRINRDHEGALVVLRLERRSVVADSPLYRLFGDAGKPIYSGNDARQLVQAINKEAGDRAESVYLLTSGFPDVRADAFVSTARIQQKQINPRVSLGLIADTDAAPDWQDLVFSKKVQIEDGSETGPTS